MTTLNENFYQKALRDNDKARARAKDGSFKYAGNVYKLIFNKIRGAYDLIKPDNEIIRLSDFRFSKAKEYAIFWLSN